MIWKWIGEIFKCLPGPLLHCPLWRWDEDGLDRLCTKQKWLRRRSLQASPVHFPVALNLRELQNVFENWQAHRGS